MIIDNFDFFKDKLIFNEPGDFYVICISIRKKDLDNKNENDISKILIQNNGTYFDPYFKLYSDIEKQKEIQTHNSRQLFNYFIYSIEEYELYKNEIIALCKTLSARAYFFDCKQNNKYVYALLNINIHNEKNINNARCWIDILNIIHPPKDCKMFIDLDWEEVNYKNEIKNILKGYFLYEIKTPNGVHLIYDKNFTNYDDIYKYIDKSKIHYIVCTILYYNDEI